MPDSLIRELASERPNSRSRVLALSLVNAGRRSLSYSQFPTTHWRAALPNPAATMARDLELSLYRLLRFQCTPFFRLDLAEQFDSSLCIRWVELEPGGSAISFRKRSWSRTAAVNL